MPTFTTDPGTDIGMVRLLISDTDPTNPIYPDDAQIQAFLNIENSGVKLAGALALETIAANQVMTLKVIKLLDLQTDGAAMAKALLATAQSLRDSNQDDWAGFDIAQVTDDDPYNFREYLIKQAIAGQF